MDIPPEIQQAVPGAVGSAVALRWFEGNSMSKFFVWVSGLAVSYFGTQVVGSYLGVSSAGGLGAVGFFCGLFGILAMDKVQEFLRSADVKALWDWVIARFGGTPK